MSLRTQLTLTVTALVALVVALAGLLIVVRIDHKDRDELDRVLASHAEQVRAAAAKNGSLPTDGTYVIRLINGGDLLKQVGSSAGFPMPVKDGYSTVSGGDDDWRSLAETLVTGAQVQILVSLDDLKEQHTDNVLIVDLLVLLAAVLSAAGVWFATGLVLRPFQRLLTAARELDPADPEQRLPEVTSPREVAELTVAVNELLDRARSEPGFSSESGLSSGSTGSSEADSASDVGDSSAPADREPASAAVSEPTVEIRAFGPAGESASGPASAGEPASGVASASSAAGVSSAADSAGSAAAGSAAAGSAAAESSVAAGLSTAAGPAQAVEPAPAVEPAYEPEPATRPAADLRPSLADLGAQLDQLLDNPEMPATQRHLILAVMADDHRRMVALLEGDA